MAAEPEPESPTQEGIDPDYPDAAHQEGAHMLTNQARERLRGDGFTDTQIFEWAVAYIQEDGAGTVDGLVEYIRAKERS